jgi:alpha-tubulin suppressor-like RCC1 family protein
MRTIAACRACGVLTALSTFSLAGCGSDRPLAPLPPAGPNAATITATIASVTVTPASDTINAIGFIAPFKAVARDAAGNVLTGVTFAWSSVNPARATVNQSGLVTSTGRGWVRIIATAGGKADTSEVWSRQIVATVSVSPNTGTLSVGGTLQLTATAKDSNNVVAPKAAFSWSSSNAAVATVSAAGLVTGIAGGTATIRATSSGKVATAAISVSGSGGSSGGLWKLVHAGTNHSCGITNAGSTQCWGSGVYGQLGIGQPGGSATPVKVLGGHVFTTLWAGDRTNCAITPAGAAWCWGLDYFGSAGNGRDPGNHCHPHPDEFCDNGPEQHVPVRVVGSQTWAQVTSGFHHSCGLTTAGEAWCWGGNANGQLGTSAFAGLTGRCTDFVSFFPCSDAPVRVVGGLAFKQIAAGFWHTCGVTTAGKAYCWGANPAGQLGDGTSVERRVPTPVSGNLVFVAVSALFEHTCGVTTSGEAWCWGQGQLGRLGDGTHNLSRVPRKVLNLPPVKSVTAGGYHSCALSTTNTAYCWGWNNFGYIGDGTAALRLTAVPVTGGHTWRMIEAGYQFTCGVTVGGDARCWGYNGNGELGDGTTTDRFVPTRVAPPQP